MPRIERMADALFLVQAAQHHIVSHPEFLAEELAQVLPGPIFERLADDLILDAAKAGVTADRVLGRPCH
jgi:hypothetical protein